MSLRNNLDEYMKKIQVQDELKKKIYDSTINGNRKLYRTAFTKKKIAVIAIACILCFGTIAVAAAQWSGIWNSTVANIFQIDEKVQKSISENGNVQISENGETIASDTQDGVTVSVKQVISDKYAIYIYLNITSEKQDLTGKNVAFLNTEIEVEGDYMLSLSKQPIVDTTDINDEGCGFWIYCGKEEEENLSEKEVHLKLTHLSGITTPVDKEWNLKWKLGASQEMKTIDLNNTWTGAYEEGDKKKTATVHLKSLEISPISFCLKYDCNQYEWETFDWLNDNEIPIRIVLKDGTAYSRPILSEGDTYLWTYGEADYKHEIGRFYTLFDYSNIEYIEIGGKKYDWK